jgi:crotonobetainyl-CoA:carnitine CoA-transferase CaiB-like acyl-CoA transferase
VSPTPALEGLKVLDLSWVVAGPLVGRALADHGATVVRVESSVRIETARLMPPFVGGVAGVGSSVLYETCNAGKLGVTLDLSRPAGRDVVRDLAAWADVVVESFSPGLMSRWGLDHAALSAGHPELIMLSTSLMGQTGPLSRLAGFGNIGAAMSGYQHLVGWPHRLPVGPFGPYTDFLGPRCSLVALLAALDERERTGLGCHIDVSQAEAGVYFLGPEMVQHALSGEVPGRRGNDDPLMAPHGVYRCRPADDPARGDHVAVAVRDDRDWQVLAEVLGPVAAQDPRWRTAAGRRASRDEVDALLAGWTSGRTALEVEQVLQARGVPAHVAATSADAVADPALTGRGHFVEVAHPVHGSVVVEGSRFLLSESPAQVTRPAPVLGEHNGLVLGEVLGYSQELVAQLERDGLLV